MPKNVLQENVKMGEMVQHLKDVHNALEKTADASGKIMSVGRFAWLELVNNANRGWTPQICYYNNKTFFLHADRYHKIWTFWVAVLGNEEEAKKYDVELSIPKKGVRNFYMGIKGKVFSTDQDVHSVIKDHENVLRLASNLAEVRADGRMWFTIDYQLICK